MTSKEYEAKKIQQYEAAVEYIRQADFVTAKNRLKRLSRKYPDYFLVWHALGTVHFHLGDYDKSITAYKRAIVISPNDSETRTDFASALYCNDQLEEAEKELSKVLQIDPDNERALMLVGGLYTDLMKDDLAEEAYRRIINTCPSHISAHSNLVSLAIERRKFMKANRLLREFKMTTQKQKDSTEIDIEIQLLRAKLLAKRGKHENASRIFDALVAEHPNNQRVLVSALDFYEKHSNYVKTVGIAEMLIDQSGELKDVLYQSAYSWYRLGNYENAQTRLRQAFTSKFGTIRKVLLEDLAGNLSVVQGNRQQALQHYRQALKLEPDYVPSLFMLVMIKTFESPDDPDIQMCKEFMEGNEQSEVGKMYFEFLLAKIHDDLQQWDRAFEICNIANRHALDIINSISKNSLDFLYEIMVKSDQPPAKTARIRDNIRPVFIVGMPKSGSFMIEQMLAKSGKAIPLGEYPHMADLIAYIERNSDSSRVYPEALLSLSQNELESGVDKYLDLIGSCHMINQPCVIDSNPMNSINIWFIRSLFPDAPIVHCYRHPLDTIVSNYFELSKSDSGVFNNLELLTEYYVLYHKLMDHWRKLFPDIIDIHYDDLAKDMGSQIRKLHSHPKLESLVDSLDLNSSGTQTETVAELQAREPRQPVKKGHWQNYEKHLGGVIEILNKAGIVDSSGHLITE